MKKLRNMMVFKTETKKKLLQLLHKKHITQESFNYFFVQSGNGALRKIIESQYKLTIDEIKTLTYELMISWRTSAHILHHNEILILSILINHKGTLSRKELEKKSKLSKIQLAKAIKLLEETDAIDSICLNQNTRLVYLNQDFINKYINKNG